MIRIYNIIAELCAVIIKFCSDDSLFVHYSCLSIKRKNEIFKDISENISGLFENVYADNDKPLCIHQLRKQDLHYRFFSELEEYISLLQRKADYYSMIALAQVLDESLKTILLEKIRVYQTDDFSVVLNTNRESTGIGLLPRCSCIWERKHRLSHSYNRLDNFLFHFLLIENSILGELIDKHIFLTNDIFPDFSSRKQLRAAASPLRCEKHFTIDEYTKNDIQFFRITNDTENAAEDNYTIWQKLEIAAKNNCDIIVFPEMLGNSETQSYIRKKLLSLSESEKKKMPSLIILPSVWENNMNTVTVLDHFGNIICCQSKQNPFRREKNGTASLEDIRTNMVVNILHYEGIGRIAILICRDFLTTKYMEQLMRCFKLTLIIVPSFSTGSYDFRQSFDVCAHDDCNVIWINSCAAMEKGKEANFKNIGYVRKRIGRFDDDSQKLCEMPVCKGAFSGECKRDCIYFENIRGV
ncbi:MAG: hypothetical protein VZR27_01215 [Acutalibacteraceae bacterium]|nr:hypothetical protein [Clostridia bacterium]MEE3449307.1 hypothetical protein [Acutalibacteraceae bacterium]